MAAVAELMPGGVQLAHGGRLRALDAWRGWVILLMIPAHVEMLFALPEYWNMTAGRLVMPVFMLVAGYLLRPRWSWRWLEVFLAAVISTAVFRWSPAGTEYPILYVFLLVVPVALALYRWPLVGVVLGAIQVQVAPLDWAGYQPGAVLLLLCVGMALRQAGARTFCPVAPEWVCRIGAYPLTWYVGHLVAIWLLTLSVQ